MFDTITFLCTFSVEVVTYKGKQLEKKKKSVLVIFLSELIVVLTLSCPP